MPPKSTHIAAKQFLHDDYLHSFTLVFDNGLEIAVTHEMVDKACDDNHLEIFPLLTNTRSR